MTVKTNMEKEMGFEQFQKMLNKNAISVYLKEIDKIALLNRNQEQELADKACSGDKQAKEQLIISNLRFVVSIAKKYQRKSIPLADLISEGNLGLISAVEKFDPSRGVHFISYAVWWIKQSIMKAISEKSRMVRLPMNRANELMRIGKFIDNYSKENGERPADDLIADELDMNKEEIKKLMDIASSRSSLDDIVRDNKSNDYAFYEISSGDNEKNPDNLVVYSSLKDSIQGLLEKLSDREREIIEYRFGLNGKEPQSLSKIGEKMNLTKERIRQLEKLAMDQIRTYQECQYLYAYLN